MSSPISLPDLLSALPDDARAQILGHGFSRTYRVVRVVCRALRELHDSSLAHVRLVLNNRNAAAWQQGRVRSPLLTWTGGRSLELFLQHGAREHLLSLAFAGATAAARQRITCLKFNSWDEYDMARVVETLAGRLPALEELELRGSDVPPAAGAVLRELILSPRQSREQQVGLTPALLQGLAQLQQLERLMLGAFSLRAGDEQPLTQLLTTHRLPNLVNLELLRGNESWLEVDFERAAGAGAQPAGRRGMRCVALDCYLSGECAMQCADQVARAVLAAADQLQQPTLPELAVRCLQLNEEWRPPQYVQPGDPLPRLIARCGRVELDRLCGSQRVPRPWDAAPMLAVVRLMGLPRTLQLDHGEWEARAQAQELAARGAGAGAAEPAGAPAGGPAAPALAEQRQAQQVMTRLQGQRQGAQPQQQQGARSQQLQLGTATPEQVLLAAMEELEAEAAQAGPNRGRGGGRGSLPAGRHLVLLRGTLPPPRDEWWMGRKARRAWVKGALEHCVQLAVEEHARQQPEGGWGAGARGAADCRDAELGSSAAELAALLSGAAGASSVQRRGEAGSARAVTVAVVEGQIDGPFTAYFLLRSRIFKVLTNMWARPQQGHGGSGTSETGGGGGGSSSSREVADEEALRQLLVLDYGVRRLWASVQKPVEPDYDSDWDTYSDDDSDDDNNDSSADDDDDDNADDDDAALL
ncbi:hypothetical protein HXX76_015141 [Chlamydomonas incerta]|uniref:Uncharacterized protein n=1 Tax=Chlamydomonas incerta TaxID=51695 RepID=A0A835SAC3_CHLIN|nr:hypothetical protein HXX76_015141 [Chlamydomonas incerta]|eukprot:KAG2423623.1 hypothetical protein HXX76_015141 [Chlamydomonas incerta]